MNDATHEASGEVDQIRLEPAGMTRRVEGPSRFPKRPCFHGIAYLIYQAAFFLT